MNNDKPQDFGEMLNSILKRGKQTDLKEKGAKYFIHLVYSELRKILYLRSYANYIESSKVSRHVARKDLDEIIKTLCLIMDVEESSFLNAVDKYLTDMNVLIPNYREIEDSIKFADISNIEKLITEFDPYEKIKESSSIPGVAIEEAKKIMAAAGKHLIKEEYEKEPKFKQYVTDELLSNIDVAGSDLYLKYKALKKLGNLFGTTDFEQDGN